MTRTRLALLACLLAVALVATVARMRAGQLDAMLGTDEADYVRAMRYGMAANYFGTRERSGFAFTAQVIDEYRRTGWARPFQRDWSVDDAAGLRHYHPPLALYPVGLFAGAGVTDERTLRFVPLVTGVLACVAAAILALILLEGAPTAVRLLMATTAGIAVSVSPYHSGGSLAIGPHPAFSLLSTLTLAALARATFKRDGRWWLVACAVFGLTALTVPYWALVVPAVLWTWWWGIGAHVRTGRTLATGAVAAVAAAALAWPPLVYGAAFVKPALMYAGIVLNPLVEGRTPGLWMIGLVQAHPAVTALGAAGVACVPLLGRERLRPFAPAAIFIVGFVVLNLRVGHMKPLYVSDALAPIAAVAAALAGWAIVRFARAAAPAAAALGLALAAIAGSGGADVRAEPRPWREPLVALNTELAGKRVLVTPRPAGAMVKYYLPDADIVLDSSHPEDVAELRRALAADHVGVVLRWGGTTEPGGAAGHVIDQLEPDGRTNVGGTVVSWWHAD